jgi:hypothetical protein
MPEPDRVRWVAEHQEALERPDLAPWFTWEGKDYCPGCGQDFTDAIPLWKFFHVLGCKVKAKGTK